MSKRIVIITLAMLVLLTAAFAQAAEQKSKSKKSEAAAAEEKAPRLTIVEPVKDYGTIPKGEQLNWTFQIKNTGDADLQVIAARPSCGCTVADFDKIIKPGATGKVAAHIDTANFTGPIAKAITLETNDPVAPQSQLTIHAIVKPYVEAHPAGFVRFNMLRGETDAQYVTLYSEEEAPFEIVKIDSPQPWITVEAKKITDEKVLVPNVGRKGQAQYLLKVEAGGPDAKIGPIADKIHIVTNSLHSPDYWLTVSGVIRPPFRVEPGGINFGEVAPSDSAATRSIVVRSNNLKTPETFVVSNVESSVPGVTAAVKPTTNKGEYEVTLQVTKDAKAGDVKGDVKIFTNDKLTPMVAVPVTGTIKTATPTASK